MKKLLLFLLFTFVSISSPQKSVIVMDLPDGQLEWTIERPKKARFCVPAAFTSLDGKIEGEYRIAGKSYYANKRLKVSITDSIFYVDSKWHSDYGFQQLILVYNNKVKSFKDDRRFVRRALCKKDEHMFLVESVRKMTLNEFAVECGKLSSDAVYLDMGSYGFGYLGNKLLSPFAFFGREKQTNWICIK